jgi:hypothetical protein
MIVEQDELLKQCADISCLTDELNKLLRKLSASTLTSSQNGHDISLAYAYNTLALRRLQRTIDTFSLVIETMGSPAALSSVSDNILMLQSQSRSNPCVDMRPVS